MRSLLFVVWLGFIGADRIDLLGGAAGVRLTPFLVLTPLILGMEGVRLLRTRARLQIPPPAPAYLLIVTLLLCVTLTSVFFSYDPVLSGNRFALLLVQIYGTLGMCVLLISRQDRDRIVVRGAYMGIALAVVFNIAQLVSLFLGIVGRGDGSRIDAFIFISPWMYGSFLPRLSGQVLDMNRGGLLLVIYMFLLLRFDTPSRKRAGYITAGLICLLVTLSRSAIAAMLAMSLLLFFQSRSLRVKPRTLQRASLVIAAVVGVLIVLPEILTSSAELLLPPLLLRILGDGSSTVHFDLLRYGFELGTSSIQNALIGIGFGSSYTVLGEFFPDNEYANFHSLYISLFAETGVFALVIGLVLLLYPGIRSTRYRPLIAGFLVFSVFYQTNLEPIFWFMLAAAWLELRPKTPVQRYRNSLNEVAHV